MSIRNRYGLRGKPQAGISLIELIMFIVVVGIGVAGILSVFNITTRSSADPLQRKQALAVAEALLEEVALLPFTHCDPDGFVSETVCNQTEGSGPETSSPAESRGSLSAPFDNVNDYHKFILTPEATDLGNSSLVTVPPGYEATVKVENDGTLGTGAVAIPDTDALRITVTVTYNGGTDNIVLEGYRTRYAPTGMP